MVPCSRRSLTPDIEALQALEASTQVLPLVHWLCTGAGTVFELHQHEADRDSENRLRR